MKQTESIVNIIMFQKMSLSRVSSYSSFNYYEILSFERFIYFAKRTNLNSMLNHALSSYLSQHTLLIIINGRFAGTALSSCNSQKRASQKRFSVVSVYHWSGRAVPKDPDRG